VAATSDNAPRTGLRTPLLDREPAPRRVLIFQTAFLGDLVLTLHLIDAVREAWPDTRLFVVAIPSTRELLERHPAVDGVLVYDKRGRDHGLFGMRRMVHRIRALHADLVLSAHRSFRTGLLLFLSSIPRRVGFAGTPGASFYTHRVPRDLDQHEGARNLALLGKGALERFSPLPRLAPDGPAAEEVDNWLKERALQEGRFVCIAPGSVWATKRWPRASWTTLARMLRDGDHLPVVIVGGPDDRELGDGIHNAAGDFRVPASVELLRRARLLVTGDTAPLHLGVAAETPVLAIFGPTVPAFGFAPTGEFDRVIGLDLDCRPCAIHGSDECPLGHHHCMLHLQPSQVHATALDMLGRIEDASGGEGA